MYKRCQSADTMPCNIMGMKPVLRVNIDYDVVRLKNS